MLVLLRELETLPVLKAAELAARRGKGEQKECPTYLCMLIDDKHHVESEGLHE